MAVGGSRRAAYNAGISVPRTVCLTYVVSGMLSAFAGILYAARLSGAGPDTGIGLELTAVTAALIGGNSVGGGRRSVGKALMGTIIVSLLVNGLVRLGLQNGASSMIVGAVLLIAIAIDVRWTRWRHSLRAKVYVSPGYLALPAAPLFVSDPSSPYAMNDRLRDVEVIGLGEVDGPEDVILDQDANLYCSVRQGEIVRFLAPDYAKREVYAHVGGRPLGMAFDKDGSLVVCIGRIDRQGRASCLAGDLAYPYGLLEDAGSIVVSESWRCALTRIFSGADGRKEPLPGRRPVGRRRPSAES
jgi:ribose transport system permease protein